MKRREFLSSVPFLGTWLAARRSPVPQSQAYIKAWFATASGDVIGLGMALAGEQKKYISATIHNIWCTEETSLLFRLSGERDGLPVYRATTSALVLEGDSLFWSDFPSDQSENDRYCDPVTLWGVYPSITVEPNKPEGQSK